jgi:hypothetical protein
MGSSGSESPMSLYFEAFGRYRILFQGMFIHMAGKQVLVVERGLVSFP